MKIAKAPHGQLSIIARIERRVVLLPNGCWQWNGSDNGRGYGQTPYLGKHRCYVHRIVYELLRGPIPEGYELDHTCHDPQTCAGGVDCPHRRCVNPDHLEVVTSAENKTRGASPAAVNARKTHCLRGHEFTPENTIRSAKGGRECRTCRRARRRQRAQGRLT